MCTCLLVQNLLVQNPVKKGLSIMEFYRNGKEKRSLTVSKIYADIPSNATLEYFNLRLLSEKK